MKVPQHQLQATLGFYRDVLGLEHLKTHGTSEAFRFGDCCLWIEPAPQLAQAETWFELQTDDLPAAAAHLAKHGVVRCDDIEQLPHGFKGFWIINPAGIVNLVAHPSEDPGL